MNKTRREKPHIIILNPDEMRADVLGHLGNPAQATPFLDQLSRTEAVSFSRAYCQNPVCVPSRCSFFTGLYPHSRGHRTMSYLLHPEEPTLFSELKDAGYHVWMNGRNDFLAGQFEGLEYRHADEIFPYHVEQEGPLPKILPTFETAKTVTPPDMPVSVYSHYTGRTERAENDRDWTDTAGAVQRILTYDHEEPLCLFVGWNNPHVPYAAEEPYYSSIDREKVPDRVPFEDLTDPPLILGKIREYAGLQTWTEEQFREIRAVYLAQCRKVDDMVFRIIEALKSADMYDDSAIFIMSDHGDFTGDYGLVEKSQNAFPDCLVRVPFLIKPPKYMAVDAGVSDSLTELTDLYATIMDMAGVTPGHTQYGKSLVPVLSDRTLPHKAYVFAEGGRTADELHCDEWHDQGENGPSKNQPYWPKQMAQKDPEAHEKGTMIFDGRYKYIKRLSGRDEFYDLEKDPKERCNLFQTLAPDDPVLLRLKAQMLDWYQSTCDTVPYSFDSRFSEDQFWNAFKSIVPAEKEADMRAFIRKNWPPILQAAAYARKLMGGEDSENPV